MSKTLVTDLYQLTMNAVYAANNKVQPATFDLFFRRLPKDWGYVIAAGLEDVIEYLEHLQFEQEDIDYLTSQHLFSKDYLASLKDFRFTGDVWAVPEGTVVFPNEPILRVTAPKMEAQLIETYLLNKVNFQSLIATKASRVVYAAGEAAVIDFGLRRAHDESAGIKGARSCFIGGCVGTSNVEAGRSYGIPVKGTHAHSFVMSFDQEIDAFRAYVKTFPDNATLLIDTYGTIQGARNACIVAKELEAQGKKLRAVRLDSGDLATLSKEVRTILNARQLPYVKILASNDLNEYKIAELRSKNAPIDAYGVGTEMITSKDCPALGGVYKLAEDTDGAGNLVARIKLSEGKQTLPGRKQVHRSSVDGRFVQDTIALGGETVAGTPLLIPVFENGVCVYQKPTLNDVQKYARQQLNSLSNDVRLLTNPKSYSVSCSKGLHDLVETMTKHYKQGGVV